MDGAYCLLEKSRWNIGIAPYCACQITSCLCLRIILGKTTAHGQYLAYNLNFNTICDLHQLQPLKFRQSIRHSMHHRSILYRRSKEQLLWISQFCSSGCSSLQASILYQIVTVIPTQGFLWRRIDKTSLLSSAGHGLAVLPSSRFTHSTTILTISSLRIPR